MITSRAHLIERLHQASEAEHSLCCQYLYAAFSLRRTLADFPEQSRGDTAELVMTATQTWAYDIYYVARQEMDGINRIAPANVPFDVQIGRMDEVSLRRFDPLDPSRQDFDIWQLAPNDFAARVPVTYRHLSDEVVETIFPAEPRAGNANSLFTGYFNQRKQLLSLWLSDPGLDPLTAAGYRARVRVLDAFTNPSGGPDPGLIEDRLGLQCIWDHPIRGRDASVGKPLAPFVDVNQDWHTRFWMGGWDGDLLVGWTAGRIDVPLL